MKTKNIKKRFLQILFSLITGFLLLIPLNNMAQQLSPEVVCSGGGSFYKNSVYLDFSIGQIADELLTSSGTLLTQGFLQGGVVGTAVSENLINETNLRVYPVPAITRFFIENNTIETTCTFIMRDMQGRVVRTGNANKRISQVDVTSLNSGLYFLTLYLKEQQPVTKKIIKQ